MTLRSVQKIGIIAKVAVRNKPGTYGGTRRLLEPGGGKFSAANHH
jgi:hypothetical protein